MNKTIYIILAIIILIIAGGIIAYQKNGNNIQSPPEVTIPETGAYSPQQTPQPTEESATTKEEEVKTEQEVKKPQQGTEVNIVTNTDSGFSPNAITIHKGEIVTWKNESSQPVWPASALHPTHDVYPAKGGCIGSAFDVCKGIEKGESWSFVFDFIGTWKYHDHLNPNHFGTVIVK